MEPPTGVPTVPTPAAASPPTQKTATMWTAAAAVTQDTRAPPVTRCVLQPPGGRTVPTPVRVSLQTPMTASTRLVNVSATPDMTGLTAVITSMSVWMPRSTHAQTAKHVLTKTRLVMVSPTNVKVSGIQRPAKVMVIVNVREVCMDETRDTDDVAYECSDEKNR